MPKSFNLTKNDIYNCGDVVGVSMPIGNGRILELIPPKMNFDGVLKFDIS